MMLTKSIASLLTACVFVIAIVANPTTVDAARPNIIVIFSDDQGYADVGTQDVREDIETPYIDALAESGVVMPCGFVTAPQCMPSRAGLLTGRYQQHSGVESNLLWTLPNKSNSMLPGVGTIASYLKEAGYTTGMSGKWGVGGSLSRRDVLSGSIKLSPENLPLMPQARGFDDYLCGTMNPYIASHSLEGTRFADGPRIVRDSRYRVIVQADAAVNFIDRHALDSEPFFLYFAPYTPHSPFDAPDSYLEKFKHIADRKRQTCLAMMSCLDDSVGRITAALERHGITDNTLIWYISDNGAPKNGGGSNEPWRGSKGNLLDGGIRVPFLVSWPDRLASGEQFEPMVSTLDVLPTCLAAAQAGPLPERLDGVNLLPFITGENTNPPHEQLFFRWTFGANTQAAIRTKKWKLHQQGNGLVLYDLSRDPQEMEDVAASHSDVTSDLKNRLNTWLETLPEVHLSQQARRKRPAKAKRQPNP